MSLFNNSIFNYTTNTTGGVVFSIYTYTTN